MVSILKTWRQCKSESHCTPVSLCCWHAWVQSCLVLGECRISFSLKGMHTSAKSRHSVIVWWFYQSIKLSRKCETACLIRFSICQPLLQQARMLGEIYRTKYIHVKNWLPLNSRLHVSFCLFCQKPHSPHTHKAARWGSSAAWVTVRQPSHSNKFGCTNRNRGRWESSSECTCGFSVQRLLYMPTSW